jgi:hypothetical protein
MEQEIARLGAFIGEWRITPDFAFPVDGDVGGRVTFEWMVGEKFLLQRWEVAHPDAPDGLAVIGYDADKSTYLQHYFDSRGVARLYVMGLDGAAWTLERDHPGFSQRWTSTFSDDGGTIRGAWEKCTDGSTWQHDFELTYTKIA